MSTNLLERTTTMPVNKYSISMAPEVSKQIELRGAERSTLVTRDLARYYYLLRGALFNLRSIFAENELGLISDALKNTTINGNRPEGVKYLADAVIDHDRFHDVHLEFSSADDEPPHAKWNVDM